MILLIPFEMFCLSRFLEENPNANRLADDDEDEQLVEYDADGNPIVTYKKKVVFLVILTSGCMAIKYSIIAVHRSTACYRPYVDKLSSIREELLYRIRRYWGAQEGRSGGT